MHTPFLPAVALLMLLAMPFSANANNPLTTLAKAVVKPSPVYPQRAVDSNIEGVVLIKVDIEATGTPSNFTPQESDSNPLLVAAAMESLKQWHFVPATRDGQPVSSSMTVRVRFELQDDRYHNGSVLGPTAPWAR